MKLTINIHSFTDVITNSSTEIYVASSQYTIDCIKAMVNSILDLANSNQTFDDLFTISLDEPSFRENNEWYDEQLKYFAANSDNSDTKTNVEEYLDIYVPWGAKSDDPKRIKKDNLYDSFKDEFESYVFTEDDLDAIDQNYCDKDYESRFYDRSYTISAIDPNNANIAKLFGNIQNMFDINARDNY